MKKSLLSIAAVTASVSSFAHEGHGHTDGFTIQHYFTEPVHIISLLAGVVVLAVVIRYFKKAAAKK